MRGDRFCPNCGADHSADATADVLAQAEEAALQAVLRDITLGEYEIQGILGRGGMGLVYLAHDISLNKKVAIKVLPPALLRGDAAVERFRREARIAASLRHRHITSVFALKETSQLLYFVMEYVEGRALDAILRDEKRLPLAVAQAILVDAAGALSYAHRREVVHRDLKPANIMVDDEGIAMIADFGVAKVRTVDGLTASGSTVGSPKYMSPEQWSGTATSLSDQYGLGCVVYETLAGRAPFEGETIESLLKQLVLDEPRPLSELRPDCPPPMAAAVMRMLAKVPAQRWPNLDAAVAAMGLHPVSPDDPVRLRLAQLAKRGHDVRPFPKTPQSPIPATKGITRARPDRQRSRRSSIKRALVWWAGAVMVAAIAFGVYLFAPLPAPVLPAPRLVAEIEITDAPATLAPGARARLTGRAIDSSGVGVDSASVVWSSNDTSIVSISLDGWVTALAPGTATVTASSGDKHASMSLTVPPRTIATLQVTPREARITAGDTVRLSAIARDVQGQVVTIRSIHWTSSAPGIVTVSSLGEARGVNPGTATVTAVSGGERATVTIVVMQKRATALEVRPVGVRVAVGQAAQLSVWARDGRGGALGQRSALWTTSNGAVASVSVNGVVTGLAPGTTTITAWSADLNAAATVEVFAVRPPSPGVLQVLVTPWANVTVDEVSRGQRTRGADTLSAGVPHRLRFERPGFTTIDTTITLRPGEQRLLRVQMTRRDP